MRQEGNASFQMRDRQIVLTVVKKNSGTIQTATISPISTCKPGDILDFSPTLTTPKPNQNTQNCQTTFKEKTLPRQVINSTLNLFWLVKGPKTKKPPEKSGGFL